ncbi:MAG: hypothetical protein Q9187_007207 [Circinaria calcarea]
MTLRRSARIGMQSGHCAICGTVPVSKTHTLPSNVTRSKNGITLKAGRTPGFHTRQHSTDDLLETITQYLAVTDQEGMEEDQQKAFDSFEEWDGLIDPAKSKTKLRKYFLVLDRMLFAGSLKRFTRVRFDDPVDPAQNSGQTKFAPNSLPDEPLVNISLTAALPESAPGARKDQGRTITEILLHQMVHAFLLLFHCHCDGCLSQSMTTLGLTWHGEAWSALAGNVGEFTYDYLENLDVDGIGEGVEKELAALREAVRQCGQHHRVEGHKPV